MLDTLYVTTNKSLGVVYPNEYLKKYEKCQLMYALTSGHENDIFNALNPNLVSDLRKFKITNPRRWQVVLNAIGSY